jgi:hypothetical protein
MVSAVSLFDDNSTREKLLQQNSVISLKFTAKNERKLLKVFLLERLHQVFYELFHSKIQSNYNNDSMECYKMDSKIIQLLIQSIIETGEYTLEGIAFYTRIPFDIIYDAACGISNQFSITPWTKIIDLYLKLKPEIEKILIEKLLDLREKNRAALSLLLHEI